MKLNWNSVKPVYKTIRQMILSVAHLSKNRRTIAKIKNDFYNAFWYDVFYVKGSEAVGLPDEGDGIINMRRWWYVNIPVQISGLLSQIYDQTKLISYNQAQRVNRQAGYYPS
jgi:hypothetical protein